MKLLIEVIIRTRNLHGQKFTNATDTGKLYLVGSMSYKGRLNSYWKVRRQCNTFALHRFATSQIRYVWVRYPYIQGSLPFDKVQNLQLQRGKCKRRRNLLKDFFLQGLRKCFKWCTESNMTVANSTSSETGCPWYGYYWPCAAGRPWTMTSTRSICSNPD